MPTGTFQRGNARRQSETRSIGAGKVSLRVRAQLGATDGCKSAGQSDIKRRKKIRYAISPAWCSVHPGATLLPCAACTLL